MAKPTTTGTPDLRTLAAQLAALTPEQLAGLANGAVPAPKAPANLPAAGSTVSATVVASRETNAGYAVVGKGNGFVFNIYAMREDSAAAKKALRDAKA